MGIKDLRKPNKRGTFKNCVIIEVDVGIKIITLKGDLEFNTACKSVGNT